MPESHVILVEDFVTLDDWVEYQDSPGAYRISSRYVRHSGGSLFLPGDGGPVRIARPVDNAVPGEMYTGGVWLYLPEERTVTPAGVFIASAEQGGPTQRVIAQSALLNFQGWVHLSFTWTQPDWDECWFRIQRSGSGSAQVESYWSGLRVTHADEEDES